jgi:hypothetical protein
MNQVLVIGGVVTGLFAVTYFVGEMTAKRRVKHHRAAHASDFEAADDRLDPTGNRTS